jgi:multiple sugar transport system substrate-binding protein
MTHQDSSRRRFLQALGVTTGVTLSGCLSESQSTDETTPTNSSTTSSTPENAAGLPAEEDAVAEWGPRINEHCREANIDWQQFEGTSLVMGMNVHPFTETTKPLLPYFEDLTGISVEYSTHEEEKLWNRISEDMAEQTGLFDGIFLGLWPSAGYHHNGWVRDLTTFINDSSLTDREWLALEDFPEATLEVFTYQGSFDDGGEFVGVPFGTEVYGCVGYDRPTFEQLGLDEPTTFEELRTAARTIHESDAVEKAGIASRASEATLSTANFATMFKSYGADWLDYEAREPTLDSSAGTASLEMFAALMGEYGPDGIGEFDWYTANQAFSNGDVGIIYHTPTAGGVFSDGQYERTEWLPPLEGPDGDRLAATWEWALGISEFSENPGATWLFIQWATCREMNFLTSTKQWDGQTDYGHARSEYLFAHDEYDDVGQKDSWIEAHRDGIQLVPNDPPPVPLHVPQNMDIMSDAATAMNDAIVGRSDAGQALSDAAENIEPLAASIPDSYVESR